MDMLKNYIIYYPNFNSEKILNKIKKKYAVIV